MRVGIWWIRRDLRLHDNPALTAAAEEGGVIPLFILDPHLLATGALHTPRGAFLREGLSALDRALRARGGRVVFRSGRPAEVLEQIVRETGARAVSAAADVSSYARRRDEEVAGRVPLRLVGGPSALPAELMARAEGVPYLVYGPFRNAWRQRVSAHTLRTRRAPARIETPPHLASDPHPSGPPAPEDFPPDEREARRRLRAFVGGRTAAIYHYGLTRDRLDLDGTSRLSPYLRAGMLSSREVVVAALRAIEAAPDAGARASAQRWLDELIWREFYIALLLHKPELHSAALRPKLRHLRWDNSPHDFSAWQEGRTGYPVVDAAMRQLRAAAWIPNRGRMIVASFLVKHLLIDWRWGARHFLRYLVDGDTAANSGGWQWAAGTGTDAAPYFRVFNPVLQGQRWDPKGTYVRRWVPELTRVPVQYLHRPWKMPRQAQRRSGCVIGKDYPGPIVDHRVARERALTVYRAALRGAASPHPSGSGVRIPLDQRT